MTEAPQPAAPAAPVTGGRALTDVVVGLEDAAIGTIIPTGFEPLDKILDGGLRSRDLTLVAGVPGVGKTVMALQWARNVAAHGFNTAYVCYEHDDYLDPKARGNPGLRAVRAARKANRSPWVWAVRP